VVYCLVYTNVGYEVRKKKGGGHDEICLNKIDQLHMRRSIVIFLDLEGLKPAGSRQEEGLPGTRDRRCFRRAVVRRGLFVGAGYSGRSWVMSFLGTG
jgi:hypothetical protein